MPITADHPSYTLVAVCDGFPRRKHGPKPGHRSVRLSQGTRDACNTLLLELGWRLDGKLLRCPDCLQLKRKKGTKP